MASSEKSSNVAEVVQETTGHPPVVPEPSSLDHAVEETNVQVDEKHVNEIDKAGDAPLDKKNRKSLLDALKLPPLPAYDLSIQGLSIGVPPPERYLPLPVPIPYPAFLSKEKDLSYLEQTIIHDVNVQCGSGEVLAM